ncbi:6911_t:CDS:2, partial [Gigaspora rosea]
PMEQRNVKASNNFKEHDIKSTELDSVESKDKTKAEPIRSNKEKLLANEQKQIYKKNKQCFNKSRQNNNKSINNTERP